MTQPLAPPLVDLHRMLLLIRQAELTVASLYKEQEMRTPTHLGVGQEAVAAGVCAALEREDVIYSHHRCHNHYLAKGGDLTGLFAELYGREAGCSRGRGGSVHLTDRSVGVVATTAILAEAAALATGSALAFAMDRAPRVAVAFFGDGAMEEGATYESLNYAALRRLPVLFVCENNLYATETPRSKRQPEGTRLCARAEAFGVPAEVVDGNDVEAVYAAAGRAVAAMRAGQGPVFLECMTYRWLEHVGPYYDHELGRSYRSEEEVRAWQERCPVRRSAARLIEHGLADAARLAEWEAETAGRVAEAAARAKASPWPDPRTLFDHAR